MYYVGKNGQQTGPFSLDQLKAMYASGEVLPTDLTWKEGTADWKPASTFPELAAPAPAAAQAPTSTPAASTTFDGGSMGSTPMSTTVDPSPTVLPPSAQIPGAMNMGYPMAVGPKQNPMAITGLVLGIVSLFSVCCCFISLPVSIAGIVFSAIGMNQIKKDPINQLGKPLALTGLILSIVGLVICIIWVAINGMASMADFQRIQHEVNQAK
jgi:hypothetical protein